MKRVHLWDPQKLGTAEGGTIEPGIVREAAVSIARFAVGGYGGRYVGEPVFERITEGRQRAQDAQQIRDPLHTVAYSACGDLCHYVLRCLGCRDETLVNRNDDGGSHPWSVGRNLSMMNGSKLWVRHTKGVLPGRGDLCMVESPLHVLVFDELLDDGTIITYEYGGWDQKRGACGRQKKQAVSYPDGRLHFGGRVLLGFIPITTVPLTESAIVPDSFSLGVPDENPYEEQKIMIDEG